MHRAALILLVLPLATSAARAESRTEYYADRTLIPDAIGGGMVALALAMASGEEVPPGAPVLAIAGTLTFVLGAPLIHGARNNNGSAFASLGLRVALPVAGAYLAPGDNGRLGLFVGMGAAVVIDGVLLARQTVEIAPRTWAPTAIPLQGGVSLGVAGAF